MESLRLRRGEEEEERRSEKRGEERKEEGHGTCLASLSLLLDEVGKGRGGGKKPGEKKEKKNHRTPVQVEKRAKIVASIKSTELCVRGFDLK